MLLPARDLIGGNGKLCGQLHALCRCFTSPGVATRSDGALRQHRHTLRSPDVGDHCGPGVRPPIMAGGSGAQLIRTSGSEAGCGQKLSRLPVSLRRGRLPFLPSFHTATRTPPRQYTHVHACLSVCLHGGLLACVPSTHACSHDTRGVWQHVYFLVYFLPLYCYTEPFALKRCTNPALNNSHASR